MDLQLNGKRALVTGSSTGIGRAAARVLDREGAVVLVHGRDAARSQETVELIEQEGGHGFLAFGDLTSDEGAAAVAEAAAARVEGIDI